MSVPTKLINKYAVFIIVILCFVSRLPQLLSEHLFLDGDESIVGLMAKHFSEGKGIPFFFYGQSYGFSFIEVVAIRISYGFFGISDFAVKLSMLFLWTIGIIFFYKTLKEIEPGNNKWAPLLVTMVFIFSPSFAIWSMKARGGYLTAFMLSTIVAYLLANKRLRGFLIVPFITGYAIIVIYQSQALWLAGLIPIVGYYIFQNRQLKFVIPFFAGIVTGAFVFYLLKLNLPSFWSPSVLSLSNFNLETISSIPLGIYQSQTGSYIYGVFQKPFIINRVLTISTITLFLTTLVAGLIFIIKRKKVNPLFYVLCISVLGTISYLVFTDGSNPRYLLPLSGYAFFMLFLFINSIDKKRIVNSVLVLFILLGAFSMYEFKNFDQGNKTALIYLIDELESLNIEHVYCEKGLLQWQLMFYSKEKVIARYKSNVDRYPEYIKRVDHALDELDVKTALVGIYEPALVLKSSGVSSVDDELFIYENPSRELLDERGFDLNKTNVN